LLALFFMFFFINNVFAFVDNINKIIFTTDTQIIKILEVSKEINVQAQNISNIGEKMDVSGVKLSLVSSSLSGEFSASLTKWEKIVTPLTVNSNWTGRTFYYKNSIEGIDIITATLLVSGKSFIATQNITIGDSSSGGSIIPPIVDPPATTTATTTDSISTSTATTTIITKIVNHTVYVSTHSDSEDLSNYVKEESFQISAGRERISYIGTPVNFTAKNNKDDKNAYFTWSFGDITEGQGSEVSHTYKKAGEYIVVLNGIYNNEKSVSRINVKILEPEIVLNIKEKDLEIENNSENEINIGGWKIKNTQTNFIIPQDTIIGSKNKIILSLADIPSLSLDGGLIMIEDQSLNIIASTQTSSNYLALTEEDKTKIILKSLEEVEKILGIKVVDAEKIVLDYKAKTASLSLKPKIDNLGESNFSVVKSSNNDKSNNLEEIKQVATVEESINSTSSISFWKKVIGLPVNGIKAVVGVFYDF
jgi:hypothetical protein